MKPKFESPWLKANENVKHGDYVRFLDEGTERPSKDGKGNDYIMRLGVIPQASKEISVEKQFQLNKTNYKATASVYGADTKNWVGKEMQVVVIKTQNIQGGIVDAIRLVHPGNYEEDGGAEIEVEE